MPLRYGLRVIVDPRRVAMIPRPVDHLLLPPHATQASPVAHRIAAAGRRGNDHHDMPVPARLEPGNHEAAAVGVTDRQRWVVSGSIQPFALAPIASTIALALPAMAMPRSAATAWTKPLQSLFQRGHSRRKAASMPTRRTCSRPRAVHGRVAGPASPPRHASTTQLRTGCPNSLRRLSSARRISRKPDRSSACMTWAREWR